MLTKKEIKLIRSLQLKKYRKTYKQFLAEGDKVVKELLQSDYKVKEVLGISSWLKDNQEVLAGVKHREVSHKELEMISQLTTPQDVVCIAELADYAVVVKDLKDVVIALDGIRDPGNLGTIIRIADWFGIEHIICSENTVDCYNPKVVQATMGSIARVKIAYRDLPGLLKDVNHKEMPVYAAATEGEQIYSSKLQKGMIVLGNESTGIAEDVLQQTDSSIAIPRFGKAESLNVAVAAGILCAEFRRP